MTVCDDKVRCCGDGANTIPGMVSRAAVPSITRPPLVGSVRGYSYWIPTGPGLRRSATLGRHWASRQDIRSTPLHFHEMAEIALYLVGTGSLRVGDRSYDIQPRLLMLAPPNTLHGQTGQTPVSKLVTMFDMGRLSTFLTQYRLRAALDQVEKSSFGAVRLTTKEFATCRHLFDTLVEAQGESSRLGSDAIITAATLQILVMFLRKGADSARPHQGDAVLGEHSELAMEFVHQNFTQPINRDTVARALHLRPETVSRIFANSLGESFGTFVRKLRLARAVELLEGTDLSVEEVSRRSGFTSYRTFVRSFMAVYGLRPSAYRTGGADGSRSGLALRAGAV